MAVLKKAIEALDPAPDKKKEITLALNLLFELAEQKKQLQEEWLKNYLRTAGTPENPTIPITNTIAWHNETRAYYKGFPEQSTPVFNFCLFINEGQGIRLRYYKRSR
jgi:hypothetical protein